ncbi:MAG: hypothetical protein ACRELY_32765 [Polyangiaceae bacterium]
MSRGKTIVEGVHVDQDGVAWEADSDGVFSWDGKAWNAAQLPFKVDFEHSLQDARFVTAPKGFVLVAPTGTLRYAGGAFARFGPTSEESAAHPYGATGLYVLSYSHAQRVYVSDTGGSIALPGTGDPIYENVAADGAGRSWIVSEDRLIVQDPVARVTTTYPVGSLPPLSFDAVVTGGGPATLPPVLEAKKATSVKARIIKGGAAVANSAVEICPEAHLLADQSPCETNHLVLKATTNDKGELKIDDVPIGDYDLTFQGGDKWEIDDNAIDGVKMKSGAVLDLGTLRYE